MILCPRVCRPILLAFGSGVWALTTRAWVVCIAALSALGPPNPPPISAAEWAVLYEVEERDEEISLGTPGLSGPTADGGCVLAAWAGADNIVVCKVDGSGSMEWVRRVRGLEYPKPAGAIELTDGTIVSAGDTHGPDASLDGFLLRLGGDGTPLWQSILRTRCNDEIHMIAPTSDGGFAAAVTSGEQGGCNKAGLFLRFDASGRVTCKRQYVFPSSFGSSWQPTALCQASDGSFVLGAWSWRGSSSVMKVNGDGIPVWACTIPEDPVLGDPRCNGVKPTADGGAIAIGVWDRTHVYDSWVMRVDAGGHLQWLKTQRNSRFNSVDLTPAGQYIISGQAEGSGGNDALLSVFDDSGSPIWAYTYGTSLSGSWGSRDLWSSSAASVNGAGILMTAIPLTFLQLRHDGFGCYPNQFSFMTPVFDSTPTATEQLPVVADTPIEIIATSASCTTPIVAAEWTCGPVEYGPIIRSIRSRSPRPGQPAVIRGVRFSPVESENHVYFDGKRAKVRKASASRLDIVIPRLMFRGVYWVSVTVDGKRSPFVGFIVN